MGTERVAVRGISPIVSVIILMALAVILGIMVSIWMTGWVSDQRESEDFGCAARTRYIIEAARYTQAESMLRFRITNKGEEGIYGFGIVVYNETQTEIIAHNAANITLSSNISETSKLGREDSVYLAVNLSGGLNIAPSMTSFRVKNLACQSVSSLADFIKQE